MKKRTKILLAESESIIAEDLSNLVKTWGFDILGRATTQDELMELAKDFRPEIIIVDNFLKGMRDTENIVTELGKKYNASLVILGDSVRVNLKRTGNKRFSWVLKPFKEDDLKKAVKKMASLRAA